MHKALARSILLVPLAGMGVCFTVCATLASPTIGLLGPLLWAGWVAVAYRRRVAGARRLRQRRTSLLTFAAGLQHGCEVPELCHGGPAQYAINRQHIWRLLRYTALLSVGSVVAVAVGISGLTAHVQPACGSLAVLDPVGMFFLGLSGMFTLFGSYQYSMAARFARAHAKSAADNVRMDHAFRAIHNRFGLAAKEAFVDVLTDLRRPIHIRRSAARILTEQYPADAETSRLVSLLDDIEAGSLCLVDADGALCICTDASGEVALR